MKAKYKRTLKISKKVRQSFEEEVFLFGICYLNQSAKQGSYKPHSEIFTDNYTEDTLDHGYTLEHYLLFFERVFEKDIMQQIFKAVLCYTVVT